MDEIDQTLKKLQQGVECRDYHMVADTCAHLLKLLESPLPEYPESFAVELQRSVNEFDFERTSSLCKQLISHLRTRDKPYPTKYAINILKSLQRKRLFTDMMSVANQMIQSGSTEAEIQKRYAQALIDSGHYTAAISILLNLEQECEKNTNEHELSEARGLLGRVYKQIYIDATTTDNEPGKFAKDALKRSFFYYNKTYAENSHRTWHGINSVAIWHRAKKDNIILPSTDASKITSEILNSISDPNSTDMWSMATAAEAHIASNDYLSALKWLNSYLDDTHVHNNRSDAFEVGSTLRQFEEVWQLDNNDPEQSRVLQVLRAALLRLNGGSITSANPQGDIKVIDDILTNKSYEGIFGEERFKNLQWLRTGFERAKCVCKFTDQFDETFGTGFLVRSKDLQLSIDDDWVILTNSHVISNEEREQRGNPKARPPENVLVQFEACVNPERKFKIDRILKSSPRELLDFSVLTLSEHVDFSDPYPVADNLPLLEDNQRIYIIGHPRGGQLSFSLYDNMIIDYETPKIHYRSPTLGGSSGSPVFNQEWGLIGLHHAGGTGVGKLNGKPGTYSANEGVWIKSIISAINQ